MESRARNPREILLNALKIVLGVSLLAYILLRYFDRETFRGLEMHPRYFLLYVVLSMCILIIAAWRWNYILNRLFKVRLPFRAVLSLTYFGQTLALVSPSRIGYLGLTILIKNHLRPKKAIFTLLLDKASRSLALGVFTLASLLYLREPLAQHLPQIRLPPATLIIILGASVMLAGLIVWQRTILPRLRKVQLQLKTLIIITILSLIEVGVSIASSYLAALTLGLSPGFLEFVTVTMVIGIITLLPITIGGLGLREAIAALLFPLIGLTQTTGILLSWVVTLATSICPAIVGAGLYILLQGSLLPEHEIGGVNTE